MKDDAREMEREYRKAMEAERAGDMEARRRHLEKAYRARDRFLDDFLAREREKDEGNN